MLRCLPEACEGGGGEGGGEGAIGRATQTTHRLGRLVELAGAALGGVAGSGSLAGGPFLRVVVVVVHGRGAAALVAEVLLAVVVVPGALVVDDKVFLLLPLAHDVAVRGLVHHVVP